MSQISNIIKEFERLLQKDAIDAFKYRNACIKASTRPGNLRIEFLYSYFNFIHYSPYVDAYQHYMRKEFDVFIERIQFKDLIEYMRLLIDLQFDLCYKLLDFFKENHLYIFTNALYFYVIDDLMPYSKKRAMGVIKRITKDAQECGFYLVLQNIQNLRPNQQTVTLLNKTICKKCKCFYTDSYIHHCKLFTKLNGRNLVPQKLIETDKVIPEEIFKCCSKVKEEDETKSLHNAKRWRKFWLNNDFDSHPRSEEYYRKDFEIYSQFDIY